MKIYCVTHKGINGIEKLGLIPFGVGKNKFPEHYKTEQEGQNISEKNSIILKHLSIIGIGKIF